MRLRRYVVVAVSAVVLCPCPAVSLSRWLPRFVLENGARVGDGDGMISFRRLTLVLGSQSFVLRLDQDDAFQLGCVLETAWV